MIIFNIFHSFSIGFFDEQYKHEILKEQNAFLMSYIHSNFNTNKSTSSRRKSTRKNQQSIHAQKTRWNSGTSLIDISQYCSSNIDVLFLFHYFSCSSDWLYEDCFLICWVTPRRINGLSKHFYEHGTTKKETREGSKQMKEHKEMPNWVHQLYGKFDRICARKMDWE